MGFRNPLTSISADNVTAGTLTGSSFRTAASGQRIELQVSDQRIALYSGDPREVNPGQVHTSVDAYGANLWLYAPALNADIETVAGLRLNNPTTAAGRQLWAYVDQIIATRASLEVASILAVTTVTAQNLNAGLTDAPYGHLTRSSSFAVGAAAWTAVPWTTQTENGGITWAAGSPTRIPVPVSGLYDLHASVEWGAVGGFARYLAYRINGGTQVRISMNTSPNAEVNASTFVRLLAGQYLEVLVYSSSADSLIVSDGLPRVQLLWVRR